MFTKIRASLDDPWTKGLVAVAVIAAIIALVLLLAGCGEEGAAAAPCTGTVTKTYTEYHAGTGTNVGGVTIPSGNTRYYIAVKRSDGSFCSQRLKKDEWLAVTEGDTYG